MAAATARSDAAAIDADAAAMNAYMDDVSRCFGQELYAVHANDAHPETTRLLADTLEAGYLVYGQPMTFPPPTAPRTMAAQ